MCALTACLATTSVLLLTDCIVEGRNSKAFVCEEGPAIVVLFANGPSAKDGGELVVLLELAANEHTTTSIPKNERLVSKHTHTHTIRIRSAVPPL